MFSFLQSGWKPAPVYRSRMTHSGLRNVRQDKGFCWAAAVTALFDALADFYFHRRHFTFDVEFLIAEQITGLGCR